MRMPRKLLATMAAMSAFLTATPSAISFCYLTSGGALAVDTQLRNIQVAADIWPVDSRRSLYSRDFMVVFHGRSFSIGAM